MPDDPEKEGHNFMGWYNEALNISYIAMDDVYTMGSSESTFYALWEPKVYEVILYVDDEVILETQSVEYLSLTIEPSIPEREGYIFDGWYVYIWDFEEHVSFEYDFALEVTEDIRLHAEWRSNEVVLNWNIGSEPYMLDPGMNGSSDGGDVINQLFEGLVREIEGIVYPGVAESWETSSDGLTITFHLRESLWSDGTSLTAHDFVYSWLRGMNPETMSEYSWIWEYTNIVGAMAFVNGEGLESEVGIEAIDEYTLEVTLINPTPYFVSMMSFYHFMPVKQDVVELASDFYWSLDPDIIISNGPFVLTEFYYGSNLTLEKNDNYWSKETVDIDIINGHFINNDYTAYAMFIGGELDVIPNVPFNEIQNLLVNSDEFYSFPLLGTYYYSFNMDPDGNGINDEGIWMNQNLRLALSYSINRDLITKLLGYGFMASTGFVSPGFLDDEGHDFYTQSSSLHFSTDDSMYEEAVILFATAATELGMTVTELQTYITNNEELLYNISEGHKLISEMVQAMWAENLGFTISLANQEWAIFQATRSAGDFSIARGGWLTDFMDPSGLITIFSSNNHYNDPNYYNDVYDQLLRDAQSTTDVAEHFDLLYQAYEILMEDMPVIPLYHYSDTIMISNDVTGWGRSVLGSLDFSRATVTEEE